jgi:predicted DNA-binding transcriptional regulator YafY
VRESPSFFITDQEETPDGLLVTLRVRREDDVLSWLLGWGRQARILEPASLQQRLRDEAEATARLYREAAALLT